MAIAPVFPSKLVKPTNSSFSGAIYGPLTLTLEELKGFHALAQEDTDMLQKMAYVGTVETDKGLRLAGGNKYYFMLNELNSIKSRYEPYKSEATIEGASK